MKWRMEGVLGKGVQNSSKTLFYLQQEKKKHVNILILVIFLAYLTDTKPQILLNISVHSFYENGVISKIHTEAHSELSQDGTF